MNAYVKTVYKRIAGVVQTALREGSTIRALIVSIAPGSVQTGLVTAEHMPLVLFACLMLAALIPDELPWS